MPSVMLKSQQLQLSQQLVHFLPSTFSGPDSLYLQFINLIIFILFDARCHKTTFERGGSGRVFEGFLVPVPSTHEGGCVPHSTTH